MAVVGHDALMTPADVLKQRLQLGHHRGLWDAWTCSLKHGGLAGLYRSLPTTLAMNIPYGCVSVAANEALKAKMKRNSGDKLGVGSLLACGGLAGAVASLATTPLDVVKTRLQTQHLTCSLGAASATHDFGTRSLSTAARPPRVMFSGFADAASHIWRADGAVGFYRGAAVRALAQAPSVAIVWTTYELFVRTLSPSPP